MNDKAESIHLETDTNSEPTVIEHHEFISQEEINGSTNYLSVDFLVTFLV